VNPSLSLSLWPNLRALGGLLAGLAIAASAQASLTTLTTRSQVGAGYSVDWSAAGGEFTDLGTGFTLGGTSVSGASAFTVMAGSTFNADFLAGDNLLTMFDVNAGNPSSGLLDITFSSLVSSFGTQVQANAFGAFSGFVRVYDAANALLDTIALNGSNNGNGDDSALFAGASSGQLNIKRVVFDFGNGAAINSLSVGTATNNVPEPGSLLLVGLGLAAGVAGARRAKG
jgi:hypothetical protein